MFEIGGCEEVWSSIFWAQRRGKHEHQMKGCVVEQKVSDWQMNAWTLQIDSLMAALSAISYKIFTQSY